MIQLWQKYNCNICQRPVDAPVMWFNEPGPIVSARFEDCGARFEVDGIEQKICPDCYRTGSTDSENGRRTHLTYMGTGCDPLLHAIRRINSLTIPESQVKQFLAETMARMTGGNGGGKKSQYADYVSFRGMDISVFRKKDEKMWDGWEMIVGAEENGDGLFFNYQWYPMYRAMIQKYEGSALVEHEVEGKKLLADASSATQVKSVYNKLVQVAKLLEAVFAKPLNAA